MLSKWALLLFGLSIALLLGCSKGDLNPVSADAPSLQLSVSANPGWHKLWGIWDIGFDPASGDVTVIPKRDALAHYDVTDYLLPPECPDCIVITVNSFDPVTRILDADAALKNMSGLTGHDVRGIVFTDDAGHELRNPDNWTGLWDTPGGEIINPFRAYAKSTSKRAFPPAANLSQNYLIYIPDPPQYSEITYAVDVSWPGNCFEPYRTYDFQHFLLLETPGASSYAEVFVSDWQSNVDKVYLYAPEIAGQSPIQFKYKVGVQWTADIVNANAAPAGTYRGVIMAASGEPSGSPLYDVVDITVTEEPPFQITEVTPPYLNFNPLDICINGDYAYVAGGETGLHCFDISDKAHPVWLSSLEIPGNIFIVEAEGDYVYVLDGHEGLFIIDVSDPVAPFLANQVKLDTEYHFCIEVSGGYVYIGHKGGYSVVKLDDPENPEIVQQQVCTDVRVMTIEGNYIYASMFLFYEAGFIGIIDISIPGQSEIVKLLPLQGVLESLDECDGYLYGCHASTRMEIIDIDPPDEAHFLTMVDIQDGLHDIEVKDGFAYVVGGLRIRIFDVSAPESPVEINQFETLDFPWAIALADNYAYVCDRNYGLFVADITDPASASVINSVISLTEHAFIAVDGNYVYAVANDAFLFYDVSVPESAWIAGLVLSDPHWFEFAAKNGYIYSGTDDVFKVLQATPPDDVELIAQIDLEGAGSVAIDGYAYTECGEHGLAIISISIPAYPSVYNKVDETVDSVAVDSGYAYCTEAKNLKIIDIDPPSSAALVSTLTLPTLIGGPWVEGDTVCVCAQNGTLHVVNATDKMSPEVVKTLHLPSNLHDIEISSGYAFVADGSSGLIVVDIVPPEEAHVVASNPVPGDAHFLDLSGDYIYVSCYDGGLRIFRVDWD